MDIFLEFTRDENHAILISSHIVSDLEKICDYIAFLHQGRLILCEEKDLLKEKYGLIQCSKEVMESIPKEAIIGKRISPYSIEAIVQRAYIPDGLESKAIDLEQLFVFMVKGEV